MREIAFALADCGVVCLMWSQHTAAAKWAAPEKSKKDEKRKDEKRKGDKRGEMGERRSIQLVVAGRLMRMSWPENSAYARSAVSIRAAKHANWGSNVQTTMPSCAGCC